MDDFNFSISPEAVSFIRRVLLSNSEEFVLSIAPETKSTTVDPGNRPISEVAAEVVRESQAHKTLADPGKLQFHWIVGASRRTRFPPEDILVCDTIPCFVPREMRAILDGRTLQLVQNELRFVPDLLSVGSQWPA